MSLPNFQFVKRGRNETAKYFLTTCQSHETGASIATFEEFSDLPNIAGAIDGTHINKAPKESAVDYFS